jgi:ribbon-helix-helix CopG family protein
MLFCMRTTLNLDDDLMRAAKREAAARGVTLTKVIEAALRAELAPRPAQNDFRLQLPVVHGRRPPRVDVSDREALYELMEEPAERP